MTEAEWNACTDPQPMLEFLRGTASERDLRLFATACCRRVWDQLPDPRSRAAVEMMELMSDGHVNEDQRRRSRLAAHQACDRRTGHPARAAFRITDRDALSAAEQGSWYAAKLAPDARRLDGSEQAALLRDVLGNPFRPVKVDPAWLTSVVKRLAEATYQDRAFDRLLILADALEDAGCTNADILNHCRQSGEHARGCWVVDLLLGKK